MKNNLLCFLIEDDIDDQENFVAALSQVDKNHSCVIASNGVEAINKLNDNVDFIPDYIFLDLNMPRMNGMEFLKEMKKIPRLNSLPVIIFSTSSDPHEISETKRNGASHFLIKPNSTTVLSESLSEYFSSGNSYLFF